MKHRMKNRGMTLIKLMVVVGIIAILAGLFALIVTNSKNSNAQVDMYNELQSLFQAQRMRATSLGVATYVRFVFDGENVSSIEPRIGFESTCSASLDDQLAIRYDASKDLIVAIDVSGSDNSRTLDSSSSRKFIDGGALTEVSLQNVAKVNGTLSLTDISSALTLCFTPNGQVSFIQSTGLNLGMSEVRVTVGIPDDAKVSVSGNYQITLTGMGMMYSEAVPLNVVTPQN